MGGGGGGCGGSGGGVWGDGSGRRADHRTAPTSDSPRDVWWTVSRNYTVLFLSREVKNAKFNQYLPVLLTSLSVLDSIFRELVMFWMWRHHEMALWRQGGGAWHSALILTTASNANSWADVAYHLTRVWQAGDTENFDSGSRASFKRKPPCLGGMELVSLSCNRVFILAESVGRGWCKIAIATKWYPFHTTDKCGFLFMPWKTDQYTFVRYTKLVNKIGTAVAKIVTFSIMTT